MMNVNTIDSLNPRRPLKDFRLGSFLVAFLIVAGVRSLLRVLEVPVAIMVTYAVNFLTPKFHVEVLPVQPPHFHWVIDIGYLVTGVVLLAISFRLGLWLYPDIQDSRPNHPTKGTAG
jgi:hypothetical protein